MVKMNTKKGFTLIELIIVVAILAVIAAIAIPSVAGLIDKANVSADKSNANEMTNAIERFVSEYELSKQDIYAGTFIPDNLDSAQGRVHSAVGIRTINDIAALEKDSYGFSTLAISRKTKYPINEKTVKQIILNYCKTSSSTFQPKQSDYAFYYSPELGMVIVAPNGSSKMELMNIAIAEGAQSVDNTEWINLTINADKSEGNWSANVWATDSANQYTAMDEVSSSRPNPDIEYDDSNHSNQGNGNGSSGGGNNGGGSGSGGNNGCSHTNTELVDVSAATCTTDGYSGDRVCTDCGEIMSEGTKIDKTGHINTRKENETPSFSGDVYCNDCGMKISDGKPIGHEGGVIPAGATYKSNCLNYCTNCFAILTEPSTDDDEKYCDNCGDPAPHINYWNQGVTYSAGQEFPIARAGDIYTFGDYTYMLDCDMDIYHFWTYTNVDNGWGVVVNDADKESYEPALSLVNGQYITSMSGTYAQCEFLETAPQLPYTTQKMVGTFTGCLELNTVSSDYLTNLTFLKNVDMAFNSCLKLSNTVNNALVIPDTLENYSATFGNLYNEFFITSTNTTKSNPIVATMVTQDTDVTLAIRKNNIFFDSTVGSSVSKYTETQLLSSSLVCYDFTPVVNGNYLFTGAYGHYSQEDDYSYYYNLCSCYENPTIEDVRAICPGYFECNHTSTEGFNWNSISYDSAGILINKTTSTKISFSDDGHMYSPIHRPEFEENTGHSCPNINKSAYFDEQCSVCGEWINIESYCYSDSGSGYMYEYNFGIDASLSTGNEYRCYVTPLGSGYSGNYNDYILIKYNS